MKIEDKFVAVKVPKDLHIFLKVKAKETGMTLGNYLFDCICRVHGIKYKPATVEIPQEAAPVISKEIQNDIDEMESEEKVEETPVVEQPVVEQPNVGG